MNRSGNRSRVPKAARQAAILEHVRTGSTRRAASALADVPFPTFYVWLEDAKFADAITKAEGEFERDAVQRIRRAARQGSWRADAWLLERRLALSWQERSTVNVEGDAFVDVFDLSADARKAIAMIRDVDARTPEEQDAHDRDMTRLWLEDLQDRGYLLELKAIIERRLAAIGEGVAAAAAVA